MSNKVIDTAEIEISSAAIHEIVAARAGTRICIHTLVLCSEDDVSISLMSGAGTDLSGAMPFRASAAATPNRADSIVITHSDKFPMRCGINEAFNISLSGAVLIAGYAIYTYQVK